MIVNAACADWCHRRIPQWATAFIAVGWAVAALAAPDLLGGSPLACAAFALGAGVALRALGCLGGGDVKLAAALGLWLGPADFGLALVAAGALTLVLSAHAFALGGDLARRGLPLACVLAPPAVVLLLWRAVDLAAQSGMGA